MTFLSWDKLQVKYKISLFGISTLLIVYLYYTFLLLPKWTRIDELKGQTTIEGQQIKAIESFVTAHPNPEEYVVEMDNKIITANKMLPDGTDVGIFLLQVEKLATECGLQLCYLKPGKIDNKQGYREIIVEISVKGNFAGIMTFLHKTEKLPRFISITTISMQLGANGLENKMLAKIYSHGITPPVVDKNSSTENKK